MSIAQLDCTRTRVQRSPTSMSTPTIDQFLSEIARILREHNGSQLQSYMVLEPPLPSLYSKVVSELKQVYPVFNQAPLEKKVDSYIPEYEDGDDGGSNASFIAFLVKYFTFLRDVDVNQLVETHDMLKSLLKSVLSQQLKQEGAHAEKVAVNASLL